MKRTQKTLLVVLASVLTLTPLLGADIKIATMRLGTSWYVFGATLYQLLKDDLPAGNRVEVIAKGGGVGNPVMVHSGKAAIGLSNVVTSKWAYEGHPEIYRGKKQSQIRALAGGLNPVWFNVIAREAYIRESGHQTLEAMLSAKRPPRIVMKPRGSTAPAIADLVFESLGTNRKQIQARRGRILQVDPKQIPAILRDGRADLYFDATPLGHPTVTEIALTGKVRFLDLPQKTIQFLEGKGLKPSLLPAAYPGQEQPKASVDLGTMILANAKLSDDLAFLITKTLCENADAMGKAHKAWTSFQPEHAWEPANIGIPLHPGAERYYRQRGWLKD